MKNKINEFESVITFVIYIAKQDKKFSSLEKNELLADLPLIKKLYFDEYGEFIKSEAIEQISSIEKKLNELDFLFEKNVQAKEINFFSKILKSKLSKNLALMICRHVASADGFSSRERAKFNFWVKHFA